MQTISEKFNTGNVSLRFEISIKSSVPDMDDIVALLELDELFDQIFSNIPNDTMMEFVRYWAAMKTQTDPLYISTQYVEHSKNNTKYTQQIVRILFDL